MCSQGDPFFCSHKNQRKNVGVRILAEFRLVFDLMYMHDLVFVLFFNTNKRQYMYSGILVPDCAALHEIELLKMYVSIRRGINKLVADTVGLLRTHVSLSQQVQARGEPQHKPRPPAYIIASV